MEFELLGSLSLIRLQKYLKVWCKGKLKIMCKSICKLEIHRKIILISCSFFKPKFFYNFFRFIAINFSNASHHLFIYFYAVYYVAINPRNLIQICSKCILQYTNNVRSIMISFNLWLILTIKSRSKNKFIKVVI